MAIDSAPLVGSVGESTNEAYVTPAVDFILLLLSMFVIAFAGAAVLIP